MLSGGRPSFGPDQPLHVRRFLKQHDLVYEDAPLEWPQGLFVANGDMGAVIWGDGNPLKITLDKEGI